MSSKSFNSTSRIALFFSLVGICILAAAIPASGQWTQPSGSSTVYKTDTSGNVGIGTTSPDTYAKVHVYNPPNAGVDIQSADTAGWSRLRLVTRTHTYGWFAGDSVQADAPDKIGLYDYTAGAFRMMIDSSGNVGIGTRNPATLFHITGTTHPTLTVETSGTTAKGRITAAVANWFGIAQNSNFDGSNWNLDDTSLPSWLVKLDTRSGSDVFEVSRFSPGSNPRPYTPLFTINNGGSVGIGTSTPAGLEFYSRLTVQASDTVANYLGIVNSGTGQAGLAWRRTGGTASRWVWYLPPGSTDFSLYYGDGVVANSGNKVSVSENGNLTVTGTINAKYQDVAEWVPASEQLPAGTVVVLDVNKSNQVVASTTAYDTRVAGVISSQPGITLGEKSDGKVPVATTGRVRVKVDASRGPIAIGDLLVTSDIPGVAMKSQAVNLGGIQIHRPGTIIGKALEPLAQGRGEILTLLSLQ